MKTAPLISAARKAGFIGVPDSGLSRRFRYHWRKNLADPGDCKGMPDLLAGLALATAIVGMGPGWLPEVQRIGCKLADLPEFKTLATV